MAGRFFMNKQHGQHMGDEADAPGAKSAKPSLDVDQDTGQHTAPSIHIHTHGSGHTVHILHADGNHSKSEHESGDADGIAAHIHKHIGGKQGQDHGFSSDNEQENEFGAGPGV